MFLQVRPDGLVGDEIRLERLDVEAVAFEAASDSGPIGVVRVVRQEPVGVFDLPVQRSDVGPLERALEQPLVEVRRQLSEAPSVLLGGPEPFQFVAH